VIDVVRFYQTFYHDRRKLPFVDLVTLSLKVSSLWATQKILDYLIPSTTLYPLLYDESKNTVIDCNTPDENAEYDYIVLCTSPISSRLKVGAIAKSLRLGPFRRFEIQPEPLPWTNPSNTDNQLVHVIQTIRAIALTNFADIDTLLG